MRKMYLLPFLTLCMIFMVSYRVLVCNTRENPIHVSISAVLAEDSCGMTVAYTPLNVPNIDSTFKSYMDYRAVTNTDSPQYKYIKRWGWSDGEGFMRASGERDLGIAGDYYMIALGSYYGTEVGTKYRIITDTGNLFYGVLCDLKDDRHTNSTRQYAGNNDIVEFIVDTGALNKDVKVMGSANVYMPLNGNIASIEQIDFIK